MSCHVSLCSMLCNVWWSVQLFCFAHFQSPFCYPSEVRLLPAWCRDHLIWTVDLTFTVKRGDCLWCVNCLNGMEIQRKFGENKSHGSASARLKVRHSCELMNFHPTDVKWRGRTRVWASIPLLIRFFSRCEIEFMKIISLEENSMNGKLSELFLASACAICWWWQENSENWIIFWISPKL